MQIGTCFIAVVVLTGFILGATSVSAYDGNELLSSCKTAVAAADSKNEGLGVSAAVEAVKCVSYLSGFSDGYNMGLAVALTRLAKQGLKVTLRDLQTICGWDQASNIQKARVLVKYLEERPERLHRPAVFLTEEAMSFYFPCN